MFLCVLPSHCLIRDPDTNVSPQYVDPLERWIVFLGGQNSNNVLLLNLSSLNYTVLSSPFMPPPLGGLSNGMYFLLKLPNIFNWE
jgi:hypothetical protein